MGAVNIAALAALTTPVGEFATAALLDRLAFIQSGAMVNDLSALANEGGSVVTLRKWSPYTTAAVADDGTAPTIQTLASKSEIARVTRRRFYFGVNEYVPAAMGPGVDPVTEIGNQSAWRWTNEIEKAMVAQLGGLFTATTGILDVAGHLNSVAATSGTVVPASTGHVIDTCALLGDNFNDVALAIAHPKVIADLTKELVGKTTETAFILGNGKPVMLTTVLGIPFYPSAQVAVSGSGAFKTYTTYFFRRGALRLGLQGPMSVRMQYSAAYNRDEINEAMRFLVHTNGVSYTGSVSDAEGGITNTELGVATNYTAAYASDKEVGVVALRTNASKQ
jgi:hypothetical protein